jgi:hypothetical protein
MLSKPSSSPTVVQYAFVINYSNNNLIPPTLFAIFNGFFFIISAIFADMSDNLLDSEKYDLT